MTDALADPNGRAAATNAIPNNFAKTFITPSGINICLNAEFLPRTSGNAISGV